jgi:hypothetical protein
MSSFALVLLGPPFLGFVLVSSCAAENPGLATSNGLSNIWQDLRSFESAVLRHRPSHGFELIVLQNVITVDFSLVAVPIFSHDSRYSHRSRSVWLHIR